MTYEQEENERMWKEMWQSLESEKEKKERLKHEQNLRLLEYYYDREKYGSRREVENDDPYRL